MIELNCSYEKSKKILELGYDFSKVCDRFIQELSRLKKPEYIEREYFQVTVFRTEINQKMSDNLIPIIPKAALEACLPHNGNLYYTKFPPFNSINCTEWKNKKHIDTEFNIYELFLYLNKNYPEELKAKFKEVMNG